MRLLPPGIRRRATAVIGIVCAVLALPADGSAQQRTQDSRGFVNVNGGYQVSSTDFTHSVVFPVNAEEVTSTPDYAVDAGLFFDISGGVRVWRNLAVGVGFSRFNTGSEAVVAAALPHPFFFDRERPVSGTAIAAREETAVHIQAQWVIPVSDVVEVAVFGGPTFFTVEQDLVSGINFTDIFPFETATFVSASVQQQSESAVGFHVGADIAVYFTPNVGVGGLVRFSRATVDFSSIDGGTVSADTGGVHVGGGLRLRF